MNTPWGYTDEQTRLTEGLYWVHTSSHGGLGVSASYAEEHLSQAARYAGTFDGAIFWYEEDCQWAIAALELPQFWPWFFQYMPDYDTEDKRRQYLRDTVAFWYPKYEVSDE